MVYVDCSKNRKTQYLYLHKLFSNLTFILKHLLCLQVVFKKAIQANTNYKYIQATKIQQLLMIKTSIDRIFDISMIHLFTFLSYLLFYK